MAWPKRLPSGTAHSLTCARVFSRYDMTCPRCVELVGGAKARQGWGDNARRAEAMRCEAIARHDCKARGCGVVCTFGEW